MERNRWYLLIGLVDLGHNICECMGECIHKCTVYDESKDEYIYVSMDKCMDECKE